MYKIYKIMLVYINIYMYKRAVVLNSDEILFVGRGCVDGSGVISASFV